MDHPTDHGERARALGDLIWLLARLAWALALVGVFGYLLIAIAWAYAGPYFG